MNRQHVLHLALVGGVLVTACAKKDETSQAAVPQQTYPQTGYPQTAQTAYPQAGYPQTAQAGYPQTAQTAYPQGAATSASTLATPGALALPCQNDAACGLGRCNVQYQKCAFPCVSQNDCAQGASCNAMTGLCLPGAQ